MDIAKDVKKLEEWIEAAEKGTISNYDLPDHGGNNGNKGVANVTAYLAVQEENGEYVVNKDIIDSAEKPERIRGITERLKENEVDGVQRLKNMLEEFYNNSSLKTGETNPKGGEPDMDDKLVEAYEEALEQHFGQEWINRSRSHGVENLARELANEAESHYDSVDEATNVAPQFVEEVINYLEGSTEIMEGVEDNLESARDYLSRARDTLDSEVYEELDSQVDSLKEVRDITRGYNDRIGEILDR